MARRNVIMSQEQSYKDLLANLPPRQKIVLQAIAKEGIAYNITSAKFIKKYHLNSASSVQAAVKLLLKNDLLTQIDKGSASMTFSCQSGWPPYSNWLVNTKSQNLQKR